MFLCGPLSFTRIPISSTHPMLELCVFCQNTWDHLPTLIDRRLRTRSSSLVHLARFPGIWQRTNIVSCSGPRRSTGHQITQQLSRQRRPAWSCRRITTKLWSFRDSSLFGLFHLEGRLAVSLSARGGDLESWKPPTEVRAWQGAKPSDSISVYLLSRHQIRTSVLT